MKYIKLFENFDNNVQLKLDTILDKIGSNGLNSLSDKEKDFIKSFKSGNQDDVYQSQNKKNTQKGILNLKWIV